nr:receptor-like kinase TMK4 [Tanacetum cinerariifolium]
MVLDPRYATQIAGCIWRGIIFVGLRLKRGAGRRVIITKENIVKSIEQTLDTKNEDTLESIIKVAELAGHCTSSEAFQRPDMCHAVNVLGPLVEQWKPSKHEEVEESNSHRMSLLKDFKDGKRVKALQERLICRLVKLSKGTPHMGSMEDFTLCFLVEYST